MKKFLLAILVLPVYAMAQNNGNDFTIKGKIGTLSAPAKVYLTYAADNKRFTDSATINDGRFEFKGKAPETPAQAYVVLNSDGNGMAKAKDYTQIYIEKGEISINAAAEPISKATIGGTPTNIDLSAFNKLNKPATDLNEQYGNKTRSATDAEKASPQFKAELALIEKRYSEASKAATLQFIKTHSSSYLSFKLTTDQAYSMDYAEIAPLYNELSPELKSSVAGQRFTGQLEKMKKVAIGAMAPAFTLPDTAGRQVSLSDFRGKYVLVDLWASWCGPCRAENPNLVRTYNKYKGKNFTILGVSLDRADDKAKWEAAINKDGLTWTHVSDLKFWQCEVALAYGVQAIPQNFLLDPSGKIVAKNLRGEELDNKLGEILVQSSSKHN
ncbi:AhpC/TSA family protein [Mucilaginibacter mali]|uniref:AhpC/TSA family protein n=1 Tax=Mucilaginibacter mali TaxID=2740462 RepID=A0A7D4UFP6_9SPHI|nr:AhpC/TSA family protein [Mucilaginibacter mali]QKJ30656.1 AhpC/TSA family protein [Mucilaginibacter mali]